MSLPVAPKPAVRRFHQASWDEPIVFELSTPGERGVLVTPIEQGVRGAVGDVLGTLPEGMRRASAPGLPEMGQQRVLKHYLRLSQENLGADFNVDIGQGTCTMKYSPKINDQLIGTPRLTAMHPLQDPADAQGVLEIIWRLERMLAEISGMDEVSLHTQGGSAAIWSNIAMIRAFHEANGEGEQRREVITTIFSHPSNAAAAKAAGYEVITIHPDGDGYPDLDALKAALSPRTAAIMVTNPEDTGIYNPAIRQWVDAAHAVGALASYDQANANGILGITRARDAGFDVCHFNLHKTFSTPHACGGPGAGANAVSAKLAPFLPGPRVSNEDGMFTVRDGAEPSIGTVAPFHGVVPNIVRAYAWTMALGAEGLRAVAEIAVLNNNYLLAKVLQIPGASAPYADGRRRIEQVRYSWQELFEQTGISSEQIGVRLSDFGMHYWTSHHPYVVPQPFTLEPTESYSKAEIDEYVAALAEVAREARETPEVVRTAPHNQTVHHTHHDDLDDPERWAITWRAYRRKYPSAGSGRAAVAGAPAGEVPADLAAPAALAGAA
ncbi:MAG TPA: aminomethyl-transferring glycine dehydrogenase subunit GcvPB [Microbacterium sp.]|uniref:aminomethyl-transferring glycine dehydrogenase subunit GcvPB n=1 Tax=Microbacterium sp. TaxID=51671 RepID=UPI002B4A724B|nr:aminomethyl-transferring glycine dehydrogenase subunit GcvPB [Microbacterium sp.]HKT55688.1 aminomethyl-transferring glycine dehydrogenase subunit GcvPB [Microbacterium sp.]